MFCVKFRTCCYRNMFKKCGSFTIWGHIDVVYPKNIQIGEGCSIIMDAILMHIIPYTLVMM